MKHHHRAIVIERSISCEHRRLTGPLANGLYRCRDCRSYICYHTKRTPLREDDTSECLVCGMVFCADG